MHIPNVQKLPSVWNDKELAEQAQASIDAFVDRRLKEPRDRYLDHLTNRKADILRLFRVLVAVDPISPDPKTIRTILFDRALRSALRYVAGPPVSDDDLSVLVTRSTAKLTHTKLKADDELAGAVLKLICSMSDPIRFPWIDNKREPTRHELKHAIRATAAMHAAQTLQTARRGYGREVEKVLENRLLSLNFEKVATPNKAMITAPSHWPAKRTFYGECSVYGRKADLVIGLTDGRFVAVEAKDSSSALNSIKRVLNDTAAKAKHWHDKAGEEIIPVALLSGVFNVESLKSAQESKLYLVWTHELNSFVEWLSSQ
jgi:hypothetical protein